MNEEIERIKNRQLARLLAHLERTGQKTPTLERDMKRAFRFIFEDIQQAIADGCGKDCGHGRRTT